MAMGKRRRHAKQASMWVATQDLPRSAAHPFYVRLNQILDQHDFDRHVEGLCERFYELTQAQRERSEKRWKKLHQFLSDIGVKALRQHLGQLLGIARISKDKDEYEGYFRRLFGSQPGLFD